MGMVLLRDMIIENEDDSTIAQSLLNKYRRIYSVCNVVCYQKVVTICVEADLV